MKQTYTFRLETDIHAALNKKASMEGYTLSGLLSKLICEYVGLEVNNDKDWKPRYTKPTPIPTIRDEIIDHVVAQLPTITTTPTTEDDKYDTHLPQPTAEQFY